MGTHTTPPTPTLIHLSNPLPVNPSTRKASLPRQQGVTASPPPEKAGQASPTSATGSPSLLAGSRGGPGSPGLARKSVPRGAGDIFTTAFRAPNSPSSVSSGSPGLGPVSPSATNGAAGRGTRVWTGPSLPPFDPHVAPTHPQSYVMWSLNRQAMMAAAPPAGAPAPMSPREQVVDALGSYSVDENAFNSADDVGSGNVGYIVTGKRLKTGGGGYKASSSSSAAANAFVTAAAGPSTSTPNSGTLSPRWTPSSSAAAAAATASASSRGGNIPARGRGGGPAGTVPTSGSPASAIRLPTARRASSPSLVVNLDFDAALDALDFNNRHNHHHLLGTPSSSALAPRRASADSSFGRSVDEMPAPTLVRQQRAPFNQSSSVGNLKTGWEEGSPAAKRRGNDEGVRASLRNLANISTAKASRIPSSLASTGTLIKDKAIKHIKTPSGGKYEADALDILDIPQKDIARQLTLMDSEVFRGVTREELASIAWTGPEKLTRAPAIVATTQHFNQVALWVAEQIVLAEKIKRRFQLVCHFIGVAKYCLDLNNFNGLRSITAGLQSTPVHRLERTWAMVGRREKAMFDKMCDLMSPLSNSESYRRRLAESKAPCVPYLGTWLGDLTFLNECIKKERDDPARAHQAAERQAQIDGLLDDIARYQTHSIYAQLESVPPIQELLSSFQLSADVHKIEDDQYQRSRIVEPKKATTVRGASGSGGGLAAFVEAGGTFSIASSAGQGALMNAAGGGGSGISGGAGGAGGNKGGTIKTIRNRMRGNSSGVKCELPVNNGLLELHLGQSLDESRDGIAEDVLVEDPVDDDDEDDPRTPFVVIDDGPSSSKRSGASSSVHSKPSDPALPTTGPSAAGGDGPRGRLRKGSRSGGRPPPGPKKHVRGHRRSKSGSAVLPGTTPTTTLNASLKNSRLSVGSVSDFLESKGWADDEEDEDGGEDEEDDFFDSDSLPSGSDARISLDPAGVGGVAGGRGASSSRPGSRTHSAKDGVGPPQTPTSPLAAPSPMALQVPDLPAVTILPGANESDEDDPNGRRRPMSASPVDSSLNELSSAAVNISCVSPLGGPAEGIIYPLHIAVAKAGGAGSARASPASSFNSISNRTSATQRSAIPGYGGSDGAFLPPATPTTILNSESLPDLAATGTSSTPSLTSGTTPPLLVSVLSKKEELLDSGNKVPGRKWATVLCILYASPPRIEVHKEQPFPAALPRSSVTPSTSSSSSAIQTSKPKHVPSRRSTLVSGTSAAGESDHAVSSTDESLNATTSTSGTVSTMASPTGLSPAFSLPSPRVENAPSPLSSNGGSIVSRPRSSPTTAVPAALAAKTASKKGIWHVMSGMGSSSPTVITSTALPGNSATSNGSGLQVVTGARSRSLSRPSSSSSRPVKPAGGVGPGGQEMTHLQTIPLLRVGTTTSAKTAVPAHYKKRKHVIRVFPGPGPRRTVLLRAASDDQMWEWINALNQAAASGGE
ncbi:Ras-specific guanine nucleotide-releasing factor RalGPS1 [Geranomyces variabilis]|nr:Ras-specific guanine nucleotide-releasing factor RalGPS1 [Geranomyces variabilis]